MAGERWIFTNSQLLDTPSRKCGIDNDKELAYRQQAANLIQEMGQSLIVTQLCINTAIVYMHRFYMFHSFSRFHRNSMAPVCLFLAAKVEEQPRKLEHVLKLVHKSLHKDGPFDAKSDDYLQQAHELVVNENILLQTLGFDLTVDHPHTHVVKTCQLVRATKDLAQTSYFLATNSLHLTTMCLQYKPTVVACACVHLACKWSSWEIPRSSEGKDWHWYLDKNVTVKLLEDMSQEFLNILDKCPSKLRKKILTWKSGKDRPEEYDPEKKKLREQAAQQSARESGAGKTSSHHHSMTNHDRKGDKSHHIKSETSHGSSKHHSDPSGTAQSGHHHHQRSHTDSAASKPNPVQTSTDSNKHSSDPSHLGTVTNPSISATAAAAVSTATTTSTTKTTLKEYWEKQKEREKREAAAAAEKIKREPQESGEERRVPSVKLEPGQHPGVEKTKHHHHRDREHHRDQHRQQRDLEKISETKIKIKSEPGLTHHKVTNESSSPLKLKIKMPKDQSSHGDKKHSSSQSSSQSEQKVPPLKISSGSSRHRGESHHKSHKSSRHSSSNSEQSSGMNHSGDGGGHHSGTNGRSDLKLHINMNTMSSSSSKSGREGKGEKHKDKNSRSSSSHHDSAKSASSSTSSHSHSGHPWTMSELMATTAASNSMPSSSSRKRPHSPATDHLNDLHKNKVSKSETNLRRSSSNHSIVSMDLSDTGSLTGGDVFNTETNIALRGLEGGSRNNSPLIDASKEKLDMRIQELQQVIDLQKAQIALQQTPSNPQAPPPPPAPSLNTPFTDMPMQSLFDMDFLSDDALPPLPGDITEKPPTPTHF
ncbi:cyclin-T2-like [Pecten maximus]|uniref:cyclin-T2-like n=1 Tax=Pecten maximus TaxID=6579 RepID=UPI0014580F93|nr:cyclin-T2-like [Pecten maximus]